MPDRRDTLKTLAALTVLPATAPAQAPSFFTAAELATLTIWTELMIPRTETPGAADAGVPLLIDRLCARNAGTGREWREALAWLESNAGAGRTALLERLNRESGTPGARWFRLLKDTTIDQYYSTREGLHVELGWDANTYLPEFKGCTHPEHQK